MIAFVMQQLSFAIKLSTCPIKVHKKKTHPTWPTSWALDAIISSHDSSSSHSSSSSNRPDPKQTGNGLATKGRSSKDGSTANDYGVGVDAQAVVGTGQRTSFHYHRRRWIGSIRWFQKMSLKKLNKGNQHQRVGFSLGQSYRMG